MEVLLDFGAELIIGSSFSLPFIDEEYTVFNQKLIYDTISHYWATTAEMETKVPLYKGTTANIIESDCMDNVEVLGYLEYMMADLKPNFIRLPYNHSRIYWHVEPALFLNYYVLKDKNYLYHKSITEDLFVDKYVHIMLHEKSHYIASSSPLRFIKSNPALTFSWYILWIGLVLFVLFESVRRVRAIPIMAKPTNNTWEYLILISQLYKRNEDIKGAMDRLISSVLTKLRHECFIQDDISSHDIASKISNKLNVPLKNVQKMIFLMQKHLNHDYTVNEGDLIRLNQSIEDVFLFNNYNKS